MPSSERSGARRRVIALPAESLHGKHVVGVVGFCRILPGNVISADLSVQSHIIIEGHLTSKIFTVTT